MRTTWDVFQEMDALRQEVDRVFRDAGLGRLIAPVRHVSFLPGRSARAYPLINLSEDAAAFYIEALAPGIEPESLDLQVLGNKLRISGEKRTASGDVTAEAYHRNERAAGPFVRGVTLPSDVDAAKVQAQYKDGIMRITLPKAESAKPKQISVRVG